MGTENQNGDVLSSWKEISAYLKCSARSCIRWENERGLPVHRMLEAPGSRVYAYKHELDAWLADKLNVNCEVAHERSAAPKTRRFALAVFFPALAVLAVLFVVFRGRFARDSFRLEKGCIVTTEPDGPGRLRVWRAGKSGTFEPIWAITSSKANTVRHTTVTTGDIDGDGRAELAAPASVKATFTRGEKEAAYFKIFINLYKQGKDGLWKTTFFSDGDCVWEEKSQWPNQILAANIDGDPASEILLKTATWLAAYDYDRTEGELVMSRVITRFSEEEYVSLASVAVAYGNHQGPDRIIVSGNAPKPGQPPSSNNGRLYYIEFAGKTLNIAKSVSIDAQLTSTALRVGDVDHDGYWEVYSTAYRAEGGKFRSYLIGWNVNGEKTLDLPLPGSESDMPVMPPLALADLTEDIGDDVLVAVRPSTLLLYTWKDGGLALAKTYTLATPNVLVSTVAVGDTGEVGLKEIAIGGMARQGSPESGRFYLEALEFNAATSEFVLKRKRVGGEKDETEVWSVLIPRR